MEMILFLDFLSSGTDGSGRELWLADCESLGPPPWLLILTGGAGGLSSHTTLSHIYTGVHLQDGRLSDLNKHRDELTKKGLHPGRVKGSRVTCRVLLNTVAEWGLVGLGITSTTSSVLELLFFRQLSHNILAHHYETDPEIQCNNNNNSSYLKAPFWTLHNVKQSINKQVISGIVHNCSN